MNLGEIVTYSGPEAVSYGRVSLNTLPMPSGFAVRYGFDVNTSAVFPQGVLAPITVVLGGAGERGDRAPARCEAGLPLCPVANTALLRVRLGNKLLEQKPCVSGVGWLSPLWCVCVPFPSASTFSPRSEQRWSESWCGHSTKAGHGVWWYGHSQSPGLALV